MKLTGSRSAKLSVKSLVSILDLNEADIDLLLRRADAPSPHGSLQGKQVALLFYENSTRTYNSFQTAVHQLNGTVCGFSGVEGTSVLKGESLHDTIKMFENYADLIVLRHPNDGAARWAADISSVPVINAGDGQNEHPTQTLLDLFAIKKTQGRLDNLKVALVGDLKYGRTVRSLSQALSLYPGNTLYLVNPPFLPLPEPLKQWLREKGVKIEERGSLEEVMSLADICYVTRIQKERMSGVDEFLRVEDSYRLTRRHLTGVKANLKVLHPLPRVKEIAVEVDSTPYAHYFAQARGGVQVRRALLELIAGRGD
ncbi:MAG: aspartate carbamoyltransferase [Vulcanimicrobiota bacterium]